MYITTLGQYIVAVKLKDALILYYRVCIDKIINKTCRNPESHFLIIR